MDLAGGAPPPEWAVADDDPLDAAASRVPDPRHSRTEPRDDGDPASSLREALLDDPVGDDLAHGRRFRPQVAEVVDGLPGPAQLTQVDELLRAVLGSGGRVDLSGREWLEVVVALDRCASFVEAARLTAVSELDRRRLQEKPARALRKDTRRVPADELAPALRIAPGTASALVGLARQSRQMSSAAQALLEGEMTPAQFRVLADVLKRLPSAGARAQVEAVAVRKARALVRARLADALQEAAVQADPAFAARAAAQGVAERDVRLVPSPVPGCRRVVADLELTDAVRVWQVLQQVALEAEADDADGAVAAQESPARTLPQLRADALVSIIVGDFAPTAATSTSTEAPTPAPADDTDADADLADGPVDAGERGDLPVDTRTLVRIPTPQARAHLAEVHVVVLADDVTDDPDADPDVDPRGPDDPDRPPGAPVGPPDEPEGGAPSAASPPRRSRGRRHSARALAGFGPFGYVPGLGRVAPSVTRDLLARAPWRRLVADPATGALLVRSRWRIPASTGDSGTPIGTAGDQARDRTRDRGLATLAERLARLRALPEEAPPGPELSYRPSSRLAAHVRIRDATCLGPACHHSARSGGIQLDHTRAWGPHTASRRRGGTTESGNLGCLCQRSHTAKTHGGWDLQQPSPGRFVWTSPLGRVHHRSATPLVPDLLDDLVA